MATSRYSSFFSSASWSGLLPVSAALSAESPVSPSSGSAFDFLIFSDTLAIESDTLVFICSEACLTCSDACLTDSEDFLDGLQRAVDDLGSGGQRLVGWLGRVQILLDDGGVALQYLGRTTFISALGVMCRAP